MDEKSDNLILPKPIEIISDECFVFRQAHVSRLKKGRIPNESHFKPDPDGLSVYWNRLITIDEIYIIIGLSYKHGKEEFKNHVDFRVFKLKVGFLRQINGIKDVIHTPVNNGNPAPVGNPNIYSHSSVLYEDDEEIRLKICDFITNNFDSCHCDFDARTLDDQIQALRERLDNTQYHRE